MRSFYQGYIKNVFVTELLILLLKQEMKLFTEK